MIETDQDVAPDEFPCLVCIVVRLSASIHFSPFYYTSSSSLHIHATMGAALGTRQSTTFILKALRSETALVMHKIPFHYLLIGSRTCNA